MPVFACMGSAASSSKKKVSKPEKAMDKDFQALLQQYEQLHAKDPDHTDHAREWHDFVLKARDLYDRKRDFVQAATSDKLADRAAVDPHAQDLTVLPKGHPDAPLQDAKYQHIVIEQGDAFMKERLKLSVEQIEVIENQQKELQSELAAQKAQTIKEKKGKGHKGKAKQAEAAPAPAAAAAAAAAPTPESPTGADPPHHHNGFIEAVEEVVEGAVGAAEGAVGAIGEVVVGVYDKVHDLVHNRLKPVLFVPYSTEDPCWSKAAVVALFKTFTHRAEFYVVPDPMHPSHYTYPLPAPSVTPKTALDFHQGHKNLRIAIAGDIGTSDTVLKNLLRGIKTQHPHVIIHLGDIYVAGTSSECNAFWKTFTSVFDGKDAPATPLWSIPGNHEYIDAGEGYFTQLVRKKRLGDPHNKHHQEASYFCLESEEYKLQILALDTGYNSKNFTLPLGGEEMDYSTSLTPEEAGWATARLESAKSRGFRSILLTHHQYYSAFWKHKTTNDELAAQVLKAGQPLHAWLWGHEHRVGVYHKVDTDPLVLSGQCLGHGVIPEVTQKLYEPPKEAPFKFDPEYTPDEVKVYENQQKLFNGGFAMLEVGGENQESLLMRYFQINRRTGECTLRGGTKQLVQGM